MTDRSIGRLLSAAEAYHFSRQEIIARKVRRRDDAINLGLSHIAYMAEGALHLGDSGHSDFVSEDMTYEFTRGVRLLCERVLRDAQIGDYRSGKALLKEEMNHVRGYRRKHTAESLGLLNLLKAIPDYGRPYILPQPSWMDQRFNGQQSSVEM